MDQQDLVYLSGEEVLKLFRTKTLSPVEFMQAILEQAHRAHEAVNCVTEFLDDRALAAAQISEDRYMGKGDAPRPLEGLPLAVKEELPLAGTSRTQASLAYKDRVDDFTVVYLQRLIDAGAIPHCKTTTPEFCLLGTTTSRLWGTSRNPWNTAMTTGGSSGGSGALLAAGGTTLATGTDIGGLHSHPGGLLWRDGVQGPLWPQSRNRCFQSGLLQPHWPDGPHSQRSGADAEHHLGSGFERYRLCSREDRAQHDTPDQT